MLPLILLLATINLVTASAPGRRSILDRRQGATFTGVATFVKFGSQGNTVCGPKSGTSPLPPLQTIPSNRPSPRRPRHLRRRRRRPLPRHLRRPLRRLHRFHPVQRPSPRRQVHPAAVPDRQLRHLLSSNQHRRLGRRRGPRGHRSEYRGADYR